MKYGYCRVSTDDQDNAAQSLQIKNEGIAATEIFEERISGSTKAEDRPVLSILLKKLVAGDTLVVAKLDRLGRNAIDVLGLLEQLKNRNVGVRFLDLGTDTSGEAGSLIIGIMAYMAEWERKQISRRTKEGLAATREKGTLLGRRRALSPIRLQEIKQRLASGEPASHLAKIFDVSKRTVFRVKQSI